MQIAWMSEKHQRLAQARRDAGYPTAAVAAEALGIPEATYHGHENGSRGFKQASAEMYARKFRVSLEWLLTGKQPAPGRRTNAPGEQRTVDMVGYVGAGAQTFFFANEEPIDQVPAPAGSTEKTVAVEIRGDSLGTFFDRWLVFYDDVRRPIDDSIINKLCVVGLRDGRILIKKVRRSKTRGFFHLLSQTEPPITDVQVDWAAKVKHMVPR